MRKNRIDIITLGCSKNLIDSERLLKRFSDLGFEVAHDSDNVCGATIVINTCGFIGDAKEESINTILEYVEAKKEHRIERLYVMGCLSERYRKELEAEIPEVDKFYGKFDWNSIIDELKKSVPTTKSYDRIITTPKHHAYIKIAEGCNRFCAFCAIPIITGRYKSRSIDEILDEVKMLVGRGVKEFNVIAQDLSSYGIDLYGEMKLAELIDTMANVDGVEWIRLHYAYPSQFPYDILPVIRKHDNVCKYIDVALQHISDNVLNAMRRHINKEETLQFIRRLREEVPGIHIRTTLMVGFPGEGEEEFNELLQFVKDVRFDRMGAFAYCEEDDTYAAKNYDDTIPEEVKQERLSKLMALQESIALSLNETKINTVQKVIVDREEPDYYVGRTQFDSPEVDPEVLIKKTRKLAIGQFYNVAIKEAMPFELIGEVAIND
ncbi:MAG: 30S ribosomal protein S12 methylthiotransferase RimO [Muribaculaceae bacterium]|nr:30S ribosomal protein S12 methylthiotransferase RimO [Muribaculaceae bacterium]